MSWISRVAIPSDAGSYERILNSKTDVTQLAVHGINARTIAVAIVSWVSLLGDSPLEAKPNVVINRFVNSLLSDFKGQCLYYGELSDMLTRSVVHDHETHTLITKGYLKEFEKTPVYREYLEFTRVHDPRLLRYLLSFLSFGGKVGYIDEDLDAKALHSWLEVEERLQNTQLPNYISSLRAIVHWMMESWDDDGGFFPKHGSGAVAERDVWGAQGKNRLMQHIDPRLSMIYADTAGESELCLPTPTGTTSLSKDMRLSVARLRFVPKDFKKKRSICMEPVDFQWAQQGVLLWYERWLKVGPLRRHVFLEDQTRNQILCWHGSITSELSTIDLSSASDSVSLNLIKAVFPWRLLKHLLGTRSRYVDIGDGSEPRRVKKFAPMGSALCFPVQCTVFAAVVLLVSIAQAYGRDIWNGDTIEDLDLDYAFWLVAGMKSHKHRHYRRFFIYGDDIICDEAVVSNVIRTLQDLSFQVNVEKSYIGEVAYRESCGKHYFNGFDVTPLRLKIKPIAGERTQRKYGNDTSPTQGMPIKTLVGLVDAANRAGEYGFTHTYSALVNCCLRLPVKGVEQNQGINPILFDTIDSSESLVLKVREPRNNHLRKRNFSYDPVRPERPEVWLRYKLTHLLYQRDEVRSITVEPRIRKKASEEFDAYYHGLWWRSRWTSKELPENTTGAGRTDTKDARPRWRWTAIG